MSAAGRLFVHPAVLYTERPVEATYFSASFTEQVSGDTSWSASFDAEVLRAMGLDLRPYRSAVYLDLGGYWCGGFTGPRAWTRGVEDNAGTVTSRGGSWMGYVARRVLAADRSWTTYEVYDIVDELLDYVQQQDGDIGLQLDRTPTDTGRDRTRAYEAHERHNVAQLIRDLAELDDGFEWMPTAEWPSGQEYPTRLLRLGYPNLGSDGGDPAAVVDGAECRVTSQDYDATELATDVHATGQSVDTAADDRPVQQASAPVSGLPQLDLVQAYDSVSNPATLLDHAVADLGRAQANMAVTVELFNADRYPPGEFRPGDRFLLSTDAEGLHQPEGGTLYRVTQRTLNVNTDGVLSQTVVAQADDELVYPGPHKVRPWELARYRKAKARARAEELRAKVGTADA